MIGGFYNSGVSSSEINLWSPNSPCGDFFDTSLPSVFFLDASKVTRNHKAYPLTAEANSFTELLVKSGKETVESLSLFSQCYFATDEGSFIVKNPEALLSAFGFNPYKDIYKDYVLSAFLQYFLDIFHKYIPGVSFHASLFYIREADIGAYIEERMNVCREVAMRYFIKEYIPGRNRKWLGMEEMRRILEDEGLMDRLVENKTLYEGVAYSFSPSSIHAPAGDATLTMYCESSTV